MFYFFFDFNVDCDVIVKGLFVFFGVVSGEVVFFVDEVEFFVKEGKYVIFVWNEISFEDIYGMYVV